MLSSASMYPCSCLAEKMPIGLLRDWFTMERLFLSFCGMVSYAVYMVFLSAVSELPSETLSLLEYASECVHMAAFQMFSMDWLRAFRDVVLARV